MYDSWCCVFKLRRRRFLVNIFALVLSDGRGNLFQFVLSGWWALLLLSGQILFYFLALLGWYREKQSRPIRILNIPYYFVSMNLAALVGLWRWLSKTQSVTWQKRITGDPS